MRRAALVVLGLSLAVPAWAQGQQAPPARGELHLGSFTLKPRLELTEVGFDSNILNEPEAPRDDFTATITPRLDADFDVSWGRLRSSTFVDFAYFREFEEERSINRGTEGRLEFLTDRFRPYFGGLALNTHARMNPEIDARAERQQWRADAGALIALTARTMIVVGASHGALQFADGEFFRGVELAETMNSTFDRFEAGLRFELTPLTTLQVLASTQSDRFDTAEARDARTFRIAPTLEFDPTALISGRLTLGYTSFDPDNESVEAFRGFTALAALTWTAATTKVEGSFERDVRYSYERLQPYYLTTGGRLTITQIIASPVDVQGVVARQRLAYRDFEPLAEALAPRADTFTLWGGGVGFRLGDTARLGLNFEQTERDSPIAVRRYERQRIYGSLTYGF